MRFDGAKHVGEIARVIAGVSHNARTQQISFSFIFAAEPQEWNSYRCLGDLAKPRSSEDGSQNAGDTCTHSIFLSLCRLRGAMTQRHMAHLMRHHAGHLTFGARCLNHPAVHVHRSAGQSKSINVAGIEDLEIIVKFWMLKLRRNRRDQPLAYTFDIGAHVRVTQQRKLLFGFGSSLASQSNVIRRFVFVRVISDLGLRERRQRHQHDRDRDL